MSWADDDLYPGRTLGPYELLTLVGTGGMAHVWAARHRGAGKNALFALKMLLPHLAENASFRDMFFDEARIASRIRHENVARTFELVDLDGILTLVMELVDGSSLVHMLRPGSAGPGEIPSNEGPISPLPFRHAVKMLGETCAGLHAAHDLMDERGRLLNVVHRDVSPHNILLTLDGKVKITDFGVAKALGKSHVTIAGQVKGKLAYMSPEQLVGGAIDRRSDVFALGSVLYEMTTGQRPFLGDHDPQVMTAIIMGNFEPPSSVMRGYPVGLEKILMRALAVDPETRYSTALQLRQALEGWLQSSGPPLGSHQIALLLKERCGEELSRRASAMGEQLDPTMAAIVTDPPPLPMPTATPTGPIHPASLPPRSSGPVSNQPQQQQGQRIESGSSAMEVNQRPSSIDHGNAHLRGPSSLGMLGGAVAVIVGLALGLGVLAYVHAERRARAAAFDNFSALDASSSSPGLGPTITTATALASRSAPAPAGKAEVRLRLLDGAHVIVDGVELPPGTNAVRRPDAGAGIVTVLVRADGFDDAMFIIDSTSPDEIEVTMIEKGSMQTAPEKKRLPPKKEPATVPPNPYD